jgi:hypothetical protein
MNIKVNIPESWNEVTVSQWQEITNVEDDKNKGLEIASILLDEDPELLRKLDRHSLGVVIDRLQWVNEMPSLDFKPVITIEGKEYGFINRLTQLSGGEWVDLENTLENINGNVHKLFAILYRPIIEVYDEQNRLTEPYDVDSMNRRANLFKEKAMIGDLYGAMVFFSTIEKECMITIKDYLNKLIVQTEKQNQKGKSIWQRLKRRRNGIGTVTSIA